MRKTFLLAILLLSVCFVHAERVNLGMATKVAETYLKSSDNITLRSGVQGINLALAYEAKPKLSLRSSAAEVTYYYVLNIGNEGFIIVSGDDKARPVLGYSMKGNFDVNNLPPALEEWLDGYQKEIDYAINNPDLTTDPEWNDLQSGTVLKKASLRSGPMGTAEWDQRAPYNLKCPMQGLQQTLTGCVATSMAIVMKYYNQGSYDYANMPLTTAEYVNDTQNNAVATLMSDCGVAAGANYGVSSTSTSFQGMFTALINTFGFQSSAHLLMKDAYYSEWMDIMKQELNGSHPIIYMGQGSGGHAFICEGYSGDNFYMNWGWSGYFNGYYPLSALNPTGGYYYNSDQGMVIGLKSSVDVPPLRITNYGGRTGMSKTVTNVVKDQYFDVTVGAVQNFAPNTVTGQVGVALVTSSDVIKQILQPKYNISLNFSTLYSELVFYNCKVTDTMESDDRLRIVYSTDGGSTWKIMYGGVGVYDYLSVGDQTPPVNVASVSLNHTSETLTIGNELQLTATILPSNATNQSVSWSSSNNLVASVNQSGKVTAKTAGSATITVTTADGSFTATCIITVQAPLSNNANLSALSVSPGSLSPAFNAGTTSYTVNVANSVEDIVISATAADANAISVSGDGNKSLNVGNNYFSIVVTAENGTTQKTYNINVVRAAPPSANADLSALTVSSGTLTPAFASNTTSYTVNVATNVASINISATAADAHASVSGTGNKSL
ncbi:MAG: C10 family peptidase, partial [Tannerella sp.]|nr:C10 family peptidase [Tannerella sp.]